MENKFVMYTVSAPAGPRLRKAQHEEETARTKVNIRYRFFEVVFTFKCNTVIF